MSVAHKNKASGLCGLPALFFVYYCSHRFLSAVVDNTPAARFTPMRVGLMPDSERVADMALLGNMLGKLPGEFEFQPGMLFKQTVRN